MFINCYFSMAQRLLVKHFQGKRRYLPSAKHFKIIAINDIRRFYILDYGVPRNYSFDKVTFYLFALVTKNRLIHRWISLKLKTINYQEGFRGNLA